MAQPSSQVLVDSGHALAGSLFAYAYNDGAGGGLWSATGGAMLTKVGSAAVTTEGGATVVTSASNTYYTLPTPIVPGAGAFSIGFRARMTASDARSVFCGNHTATTSYIWLNSSGQARIQGTNIGANGGVTTLATWWIVRDGTYAAARVYKDGVLVGSVTNSQGTAVTISAILRGLSGGTTNDFHGSAEFFHLFSGTALTEAQITSLTADPYQVLQAASTVDASVAGTGAVSWAATGAIDASGVAPLTAAAAGVAAMSWAATGSVGATVISGSIALTSPVPYNLSQRTVAANTASVTIAGTSTATAAIEYRRGSGAWQTLVASHPGGAYSAVVTMPTGQGDLQVRHASDTAVTASIALATVGDAFINIGQSNNVGVSPQIVVPVASAFTALQFDRADVWKPLQEGDNQAASFDGGSTGSKGSYVGALSNRLQANGVPVAFIPSAQGSTRVDQWQRYDPAPTDPYFNYGKALGQWQQAGGGRAAILWIGESDASSGTTVADYKTGMHALIDDWWADTGTPVFLVMITNFHANAPAIRAAQLEIAAENPHVAGIADGGGAYSGDVHYLTAAQINAVADAIYTPFVAAFYPDQYTADASGAAAMSWAATGGVSVDLIALPPGTVTAAVSGLAGMAWAATGAVSSTVLPMLPAVAADAAGQASMGWAALGGVFASDGSIVWPATRAGDSHTAMVPHTGNRVVVPDGDDATAPPTKAFSLHSADAQTYLVDFESKYLAGAKDQAAQFMAAWADAGVSVAPAMAPGAVLSHGVIPVTVTPGGTDGNYSVYVQIRTVGGRERVAPFIVQVTAMLQPVKRFRLRTVDRDVYDLNFALRHLAGVGDAAAGLLGVQAPAGVEVQGNLVGGVVQIAVDNPAATGSYLISAQISTTSGNRKTAAIVVEVAP